MEKIMISLVMTRQHGHERATGLLKAVVWQTSLGGRFGLADESHGWEEDKQKTSVYKALKEQEEEILNVPEHM